MDHLNGQRLKALKQDKADLVAEQRAILAASATENRDFTDQEKERDDAIVANLESVNNQIARFERFKDDERTTSAIQLTDAPPEPKSGFASFGEKLQAVFNASRPGGTVDQRLYASTGLSESVSADGGFLVNTDQVTDIRMRMYDQGRLLSRTFHLPVSANSNGVKVNTVDETSRANGSRYGGILGYWLEEGGLKTPSRPSFRQMALNLKKIAAVVYVTDELLQDAVALEAWINRYLPLELTFRAEDAIVNGTGSGQPLGFLNSGATIVVPKETGQNASTLLYQNVVKMWSRMWAPSRENAVWLIDQSVEPELYSMSLVVGVGGGPVYMPAGGISGAPYSTLFGRPVITTEYGSALGTVGDIMLADLSQYITIDKGGVQAASSMHVRFLYDETVFRFVYRMDGMPEWNAPLTPKSGGPTLSPFIALATRA